MARQVPLTTLLSRAWLAFTIEADNLFEAEGASSRDRAFRISLPMWANGLRGVDEDGVTVDDLRARMHAACNIGGLERWGWISVGESGPTRRNGHGSHRSVTGDVVLRPTSRGSTARTLWPTVVTTVEERWRTRFGAAVVDDLCRALPIAAASAMPWSPPEVQPGNGFRTAVLDGVVDERDDAGVPLVARLGQVLTDFTLVHERGSEVSLPLGANVLRAIGEDVVAVRDLPARSGVSKEAVAMAMTFLHRWDLVVDESVRAVRLTPSGFAALDDYWTRARRARDVDLRAALDAIVSRGEVLADGLVPPEGCWRGERPYLAQTTRMLADPAAALPWHPTVLHRGGWPDGS